MVEKDGRKGRGVEKWKVNWNEERSQGRVAERRKEEREGGVRCFDRIRFFPKKQWKPCAFSTTIVHYTFPRYRSTEVATNVKSLPFRDDTTAVACVNCIVRRSRFILPVERDGGT